MTMINVPDGVGPAGEPDPWAPAGITGGEPWLAGRVSA
jgi:hypothetical protein